MKLKYFYEKFEDIKDIKIIGKEVVVNGNFYDVMGVYLLRNKLMLLILEYNEEYENFIEEIECSYQDDEHIRTNRQIAKEDIIRNGFDNALNGIREILIDDKQFKITEQGATRVNFEDYEISLIFSQFMFYGWKPKKLGAVNTDSCFLNVIQLADKCEEIPFFDENPKIEFIRYNSFDTLLVEQPILLEVGKEYNEKIYFTDQKIGEEHWIYINKISLYDIMSESMKNFKDPRFSEHYSEKELLKLKKDTEKRISQICPKDKSFILLEYECEDDISIKLHSKKWLDSESKRTNEAMAFIMKSDKKFGILGKTLKVALIEEPFEKDSKIINVEIFALDKQKNNENIVFE